MRPTSRFHYSLKALVDLALHQGIGPVTVAAIARRQSIPVYSLEQLFNRLRRKGLVASERGPRGGYRLSRPASQISAREIFELFEPARRFERAGSKKSGITDPMESVWQQVEKAVKTTLTAATLKTLADQMRDHAAPPIRHRYTFHI